MSIGYSTQKGYNRGMDDGIKYSLGLDIGTTSVGWAVVNLDKERIEDLGVRIFERPEHPKDGKSLAEPRRAARSTRRRLRRRRQRLNYLKQFFINQGLLTRQEVDDTISSAHTKAWRQAHDPYQLRVKGLTKKLSPDELLIALYHIAKRRGYKSNRKSIEQSDTTGDGKKVNSAISKNDQILSEMKYSSVSQALLTDDRFRERKRNTIDDYRYSFSRVDFLDEIRHILDRQKDFYPNELSIDHINQLLGIDVYHDEKGQPIPIDHKLTNNDINRLTKHGQTTLNGIFYQRPFMTSELINRMRGKCPLEKDQPRAPKASYSFELFRLAEDLSHLQYTLDFVETGTDWQVRKERKRQAQFLTADQIEACVDKCLKTQTVKYSAIREVLGFKDDNSFQFTYIRGKSPDEKTLAKDPLAKEKNTFAQLRFYHGVKSVLKDLPDDWQNVSSDQDLFDKIGEVLTCNKDDYSIREGLIEVNKDRSAQGKAELSDEAINTIVNSKLSFAGFGHLSLVALRKITPYLLKGNGMTYDKAVEEAGYQFNAKLSGHKNLLPPLSEEESHQITNPVVKRAVSQTIKVVNAIIHKYGAPYRIGIECAGELAKSFKEREDIKKRQDKNAENNQEAVKELRSGKLGSDGEQFEAQVAPTGTSITKLNFYKQQDCKCPYCGEPLNINRIFSDDNYAEIDHIIPFSICGNDTKANKVLVHTTCNQIKGNQTPYQTWGNDPERWKIIEATARANHKLGAAKQRRLLAQTLPDEDWSLHAINDTRYISKFISRYIKSNLKFRPMDDADDDSHTQRQRVIMPAGAITSYLRRMWHIGHKDREGDCLHHSVDAVIVALTTQAIIQDCSVYSAYIDDHTKMQFGDNASQAGSAKLVRALQRITDPATGEIKEVDYKELMQDMLPWSRFDEELRKREEQPDPVNDNLAIWRNKFSDLYKDQDSDFINRIHPIFVSRMPKRGVSGKTNKDTAYSVKTKDNDDKTRSTRVKLVNLTLDKLNNSAIRDVDETLYGQLKQYITDHQKWQNEKNKWKVARQKQKKHLDKSSTDSEADLTPADLPPEPIEPKVYKSGKRFDKNGNPISPIKSIKVYEPHPMTSGFLVNNDTAYVNNGSMVRLDVYKRPNKKGKIEHFFVPVYAHMIKRGHPEIKPTKILPEPKKGTPKEIDSSFSFVCSLFPNDYVKITLGGEVKEGYYVMYDNRNARLTLLPHAGTSKDLPTKKKDETNDDQVDQSTDETDDNDKKKTGIKRPNRYPAFRISPRSATKIERLDINVLGDNYKWD